MEGDSTPPPIIQPTPMLAPSGELPIPAPATRASSSERNPTRGLPYSAEGLGPIVFRAIDQMPTPSTQTERRSSSFDPLRRVFTALTSREELNRSHPQLDEEDHQPEKDLGHEMRVKAIVIHKHQVAIAPKIIDQMKAA